MQYVFLKDMDINWMLRSAEIVQSDTQSVWLLESSFLSKSDYGVNWTAGRVGRNTTNAWVTDVVLAGLTHTPRSDKAEVSYSLNDLETYLPYTKAIKDFLAKYDEELQKDQMKFEDCGGKALGRAVFSSYFTLERVEQRA